MVEFVKKYIKNVKILSDVYSIIVKKYHKYLFSKDPKKLANYSFKKVFKRDVNWDSPSNLIEKIIWMQFNSDTSKWTLCADKYRVREFVREMGEEDLLNELYGVYLKPEEIDFDTLPEQFVIKTNNACATVMLVKDKASLNIPNTLNTLKKWLEEPYGVINAQLHYLKIKPCIIVEKFLSEKSSNGLIDYKFHCVNGHPILVQVITERDFNTHEYMSNIFDLKWRNVSDRYCKKYNEFIITKPKSFDKMLEACEKLAVSIPYVRIDFYEVEGTAVFGEMTFTLGFGSLKKEFYEDLGDLLIIENKNEDSSI